MKCKSMSSLSVFAMSMLLCCSCSHEQKEKTNVPIPVETIIIADSLIAQGRSYSGIIEESAGTILSFKIPGTVKSISVSEGQFVNKGQLIAEVDASTLESNLRIAEAAQATAQDTYNRMKVLHDAEALPDMKWVEIENALSAAKSATDIARNAFNDAKIFAPFGGYVSQKIAEVGNTIAPAMPVVKIVEISPVKINISVSEDEISTIDNTTEAYVNVPALGDLSAVARLSDKGMTADPLSRTYTVKFSCPNPDKQMLPGMLCSVTLSSNQSSNAMVLPVGSILLDANNRSYVWIVKDGKTFKRIVTLGGYTNDGVIVASGLNTGECVVIRGMQKVSQGIEVTTEKQ